MTKEMPSENNTRKKKEPDKACVKERWTAEGRDGEKNVGEVTKR